MRLPNDAGCRTRLVFRGDRAGSELRYADALLARSYADNGPGISVLVARGDTVLFRSARGEADLEKHVPLRADSTFRIGSVTKQFAAAGLLTLVEAGKVSLDDPLSKYVKGYPNGEHITVLQLLNHTSGVKSYTGIPGYMDDQIRKDRNTAQLIDVFKSEKPDFAPGTQWAYNNSGYVLVSAVIEAASGKPWYRYLEHTLFKPLGMQHTGYGHDPKVVARQVHGYTFKDGKPVPAPPMSMTQPNAAGALVSNVDDLFKWNRALHEGRVLKNTTYTQMITPIGKAAEGGRQYGFGLFRDSVRGREELHHGGGIFGFNSHLLYVPEADITVALLENDDGREGHGGLDVLARQLAAAALGEPYPAMQAIAIKPAALQAAEGVYRFDAQTTRVLRVFNGKLTAQRIGGQRSLLMPIAPDDFLYEDGFNRLQLVRDGASKISGIRYFAGGEGGRGRRCAH